MRVENVTRTTDRTGKEDTHTLLKSQSRVKNMPVEKAGKDQRFPCGFSHFECGNTDPIAYCASHLEIMKSSTKAYILDKV